MFLIDYQPLLQAYLVIYQEIKKVKRKIRRRQVNVHFAYLLHLYLCVLSTTAFSLFGGPKLGEKSDTTSGWMK